MTITRLTRRLRRRIGDDVVVTISPEGLALRRTGAAGDGVLATWDEVVAALAAPARSGRGAFARPAPTNWLPKVGAAVYWQQQRRDGRWRYLRWEVRRLLPGLADGPLVIVRRGGREETALLADLRPASTGKERRERSDHE